VSERGVFAVDRGIFDHPVLSSREPFSRREAWLFILSEAAWKPRAFRANGRQIELKRGQLSHSVRFLADKWGWSKSSVARFLDVLQTETMIEKETGTGQILISVCNFDQYQRVSLPDGTGAGTSNGTEAGQQRDKEEDIKGIELDLLSQGDRNSRSPAEPKPDHWPKDYREQFWAEYPKKVGKKAALKSLERTRKSGEVSFATLMAGVRRYRSERPPGVADEQYTCAAQRWLNEGRWDDETRTGETRQPNGYQREPRGGDAIIAGVCDVTARFARRDIESTDAAEGFGADGQGPGSDTSGDLELPLRLVAGSARTQ
jgi:hypothetical protein